MKRGTEQTKDNQSRAFGLHGSTLVLIAAAILHPIHGLCDRFFSFLGFPYIAVLTLRMVYILLAIGLLASLSYGIVFFATGKRVYQCLVLEPLVAAAMFILIPVY